MSNISPVKGTQCRHRQPNQFPSVPRNCMNNSNSSSNPASPRVTLKLKGAARKSSDESKSKSPPIRATHSKPNVKPGAHWSDEYKKRMQADMDALTSK